MSADGIVLLVRAAVDLVDVAPGRQLQDVLPYWFALSAAGSYMAFRIARGAVQAVGFYRSVLAALRHSITAR
jgi:hypothetical protein